MLVASVIIIIISGWTNADDWTNADAACDGDDGVAETRVKMTRMRQTVARRLKEAQNTAAMLTTFQEVDMTGIIALRNKYKEQFEKVAAHALSVPPGKRSNAFDGSLIIDTRRKAGVHVDLREGCHRCPTRDPGSQCVH